MLVTEKNINVQPEKNAFTYVIPKTDMRWYFCLNMLLLPA